MIKEIESIAAGRAYLIENPDSVLIPLALWRASRGFPSPADDYIETAIDLNQELIRHPFATFFVRATGDSMTDIGIHPEAVLIVDRAVETKSGDIVVARIGDEMCVKQLVIDDDGRLLLLPKNIIYKPISSTKIWISRSGEKSFARSISIKQWSVVGGQLSHFDLMLLIFQFSSFDF